MICQKTTSFGCVYYVDPDGQRIASSYVSNKSQPSTSHISTPSGSKKSKPSAKKAKAKSSKKSKKRTSIKKWIQTGLDIVGNTPGPLGAVADGTNALIYLADGDYQNAALSGMATLPGGSLVKNGIKAGRGLGIAAKGTGKSDEILTRNGAFRDAKRNAGIPNSLQHKKTVHVYDSTSENRWVYEFDVYGKKKYVVRHDEDKFGRGSHFHGADDSKGSPLNKGRYNQYPGHSPEDFKGYK
ncbi:HNH/endonuclease VII fold putative polymorphic toxin [Bacillus sp. 2205SS5-2]|uniref:HNH/endonuclease VII fold putative polymorphic toxin n=1 Tax=Bacillus sp. 2205SS5-2 TaxID=3109031 RepID=UPI0030079759